MAKTETSTNWYELLDEARKNKVARKGENTLWAVISIAVENFTDSSLDEDKKVKLRTEAERLIRNWYHFFAPDDEGTVSQEFKEAYNLRVERMSEEEQRLLAMIYLAVANFEGELA